MLTNSDLDIIKFLIETKEDNWGRLLRSKKYNKLYPGLQERIEDEFNSKIKDPNINQLSFATKMYMVLHGMKYIPRCPVCGNPIRHINVVSIKQGFKRCCSTRCAQLDEKTQNKIKETNKLRYGTEYAIAAPQTRAKIKESCMARYGVDNVLKLAEVKEKSKKTCLERYGVEWAQQNPDIKAKSVETAKKNNLEKYGVEWPILLKEIRERIKATHRENHGTDYPFQSEEYKKKNYAWSDVAIKHRIETLIKRYGITNAYQIPEIKNKIKVKNSSVNEKEVLAFIKSIYSGEIVENDRNIIAPLELDIYLPEKHLAIEYNGCYYHSVEKGLAEDYHLLKSKLCSAKGILLIHISEDDWQNETQRESIKTHIHHILDNSIEDKLNYFYEENNKLYVNRLYSDASEFLKDYEIKEYTLPKLIKTSKGYHYPDGGQIILSKRK